MVISIKYRFFAILLIGVFAIFNTGLPVVLHYCEMMKSTTTSTCGMCGTESTRDDQLQYNSVKSACCKTIFTPERNRIEFLQSQNNATTQLLNYSTAPLLYTSNIFESLRLSKLILNDTHSPPLSKDIPIFTSSLLI
jgi:hypothetical protein